MDSGGQSSNVLKRDIIASRERGRRSWWEGCFFISGRMFHPGQEKQIFIIVRQGGDDEICRVKS